MRVYLGLCLILSISSTTLGSPAISSSSPQGHEGSGKGMKRFLEMFGWASKEGHEEGPPVPLTDYKGGIPPCYIPTTTTTTTQAPPALLCPLAQIGPPPNPPGPGPNPSFAPVAVPGFFPGGPQVANLPEVAALGQSGIQFPGQVERPFSGQPPYQFPGQPGGPYLGPVPGQGLIIPAQYPGQFQGPQGQFPGQFPGQQGQLQGQFPGPVPEQGTNFIRGQPNGQFPVQQGQVPEGGPGFGGQDQIGSSGSAPSASIELPTQTGTPENPSSPQGSPGGNGVPEQLDQSIPRPVPVQPGQDGYAPGQFSSFPLSFPGQLVPYPGPIPGQGGPFPPQFPPGQTSPVPGNGSPADLDGTQGPQEVLGGVKSPEPGVVSNQVQSGPGNSPDGGGPGVDLSSPESVPSDLSQSSPTQIPGVPDGSDQLPEGIAHDDGDGSTGSLPFLQGEPGLETGRPQGDSPNEVGGFNVGPSFPPQGSLPQFPPVNPLGGHVYPVPPEGLFPLSAGLLPNQVGGQGGFVPPGPGGIPNPNQVPTGFYPPNGFPPGPPLGPGYPINPNNVPFVPEGQEPEAPFQNSCSGLPLGPFIPPGYYPVDSEIQQKQLQNLVGVTPVNPVSCSTLEILQQLRLRKIYGLIYEAGLEELFLNTTSYTFFAPVDSAFEKLPGWLVQSLQENKKLLRSFIRNHFIRLPVQLDNLGNEFLIKNDRPGRNYLRVNVYQEDTDYRIVTVDGARVLRGDIETTTGLLNIVDKVILPQPIRNHAEYLVEVPEFQEFLSAVNQAGLIQMFQDPNPITVFIPQSCGSMNFTALAGNVTALQNFVKYHVVNGTYFSPGLSNGQYLLTNFNKEIKIGVTSDGFTKHAESVNGHIQILKSDIVLKNGVAHVIENCIIFDTNFYVFDEFTEFGMDYGSFRRNMILNKKELEQEVTGDIPILETENPPQ